MTESADPHAEPVVIATYPDLGEAEVTRAHLSAYGIESFIIDDLEGGGLPVEGETIAVLVHAEDAEVARQVIAPVDES
jgi:hypothetical protein